MEYYYQNPKVNLAGWHDELVECWRRRYIIMLTSLMLWFAWWGFVINLYSLIFVVFICKLYLGCYAKEMCYSNISLAKIVKFFLTCAHAHTCLLVLDMLQRTPILRITKLLHMFGNFLNKIWSQFHYSCNPLLSLQNSSRSLHEKNLKAREKRSTQQYGSRDAWLKEKYTNAKGHGKKGAYDVGTVLIGTKH